MRIALDARCLNRPHLRGMGKYVWNVLTHAPDDEPVAWTLFTDRPDLPCHVPPSIQNSVESFDPRGYRFRSWEQFALPARAKRCRADVLHCTSTTMPWRQPVPSVVTIHDTVTWDDATEATGSWFWTRLLPSAYRRSAAVITISESSRRAILRLWPELNEKLHVIPHGVESGYLDVQPAPLSNALESFGIRAPYLLYLGGAIPRKRVDWAIRVWKRVADARLQLVVCGVEPEAQAAILAKLPAELRERICFAPFVSEDDMPRLYQNAVAVLYPTLYEGFGLPALEAQATGAPVLFSAVGSLAELDGPAAVVLPTEDLDAWVGAVRSAVRERAEQPNPNDQARAWARRFSWEESARRHFDVYRSVVDLKHARRAVPAAPIVAK